MTVTITVGVLALQGGFREHLALLRLAASQLATSKFELLEVRTSQQLARCDALIIPGGESTTMSLVAGQTDLLERLRDFVK
jgi:5'-phosphate synthase pdxT subunit